MHTLHVDSFVLSKIRQVIVYLIIMPLRIASSVQSQNLVLFNNLTVSLDFILQLDGLIQFSTNSGAKYS